MTEFCTAQPNICGSPIGNIIRVNLLGLRNFEMAPRLFGNIVQAFETISSSFLITRESGDVFDA